MGGVFGFFDEEKEVVDILLDPKPDRRLLANVPDAEGERSNSDRRGQGTWEQQSVAQPKPAPQIQAQHTSPAPTKPVPAPKQTEKNLELDAQELWFARFLEQVQESREKALRDAANTEQPSEVQPSGGEIAQPAARNREQDVGELWIAQFLEQALAAHSSILSDASERTAKAADVEALLEQAPASASKSRVLVRKIRQNKPAQALNNDAEHKHARKHKTDKAEVGAQKQQPLSVNVSDVGVTVQMSCEGELYMKQTAEGLTLNFRRGEGPWTPMNFNLHQGSDNRQQGEERP